MQTYYFDTKDGVPVRDNKGIDFAQLLKLSNIAKRSPPASGTKPGSATPI